MLALAICTLVFAFQEPIERTPAIFRCTTSEGESKWFPDMLRDDYYDSYCIEPKPGPQAARLLKEGKFKLVTAKEIDTPANLKWRDLTIDFANGKISPRKWLLETGKLKVTVRFLSSPKTKTLRVATMEETRRAVFAEMLLTSLPGRLCLTSNDTGELRYLPEPGRLQSWYLAMRDYLGPMMNYRVAKPYMVSGKMQIVRADDKPGLLSYTLAQGKQSLTFFFNNGPAQIELSKLDMDRTTIVRGLDMEGTHPRLNQFGSVILDMNPD